MTHYTDLAGLQGIVENKELWLSNAVFLNDPEEINHGIKMAQRVLNSLLKSTKTPDAVSKGRQKLIADIAKDFEKFQAPDVFITCLCEDSDLLSQWRGYSSRQGVNITFDTNELLQMLFGSNVELHQVQYGMAATRAHLTALISDELPDIFDDFEFMMGDLSTTEIKAAFSKLVANLVPRFKHAGFQEEREWRLVMMNPEPEDILFRPRAQMMLPYVKVKLEDDFDLLPIENITVGPGMQDAAVAKSISYFLQANGYDPDIVDQSATPYRT
ncbi:hypothetical protein ASE94_01525 [Devosia sp. Leaf64]|nr:hypothetical protein ASE94_01525 [Devosia sp. Leaf64]